MGDHPRGLIPRGLGGLAGHLTGLGFERGWNVGAAASRVMGAGDYSVPWQVSMNSLVTQGNIPAVHNSKAGLRLCHKEFIGPIYSTIAYTNRVIRINPGLSTAFPWLSKIAPNFAQYKLHGMIVTFISSLTNAVASFSSLGAVIIACDLNSAADPAMSQTAMEQMQFVASAKASETIVAPVECSPKEGAAIHSYIRQGPVPASASINDYDHCMLQVATSGMPSDGVEIGRLYISYDIEFLGAKVLSTPGQSAHYYQQANVAGMNAPFGVLTSPVLDYDGIGLKFEPSPAVGYDSFTIPANTAKAFEFEMSLKADAPVGSAFPTLSLTNCTTFNYWRGKTSSTIVCPDAGTVVSMNCNYSLAFKVTDISLPVKVTLQWTTITTTSKIDYNWYVLPTDPGNLLSSVYEFNALRPAPREPDEVEDEKNNDEEEPEMVSVRPGAAALAAPKKLKP